MSWIPYTCLFWKSKMIEVKQMTLPKLLCLWLLFITGSWLVSSTWMAWRASWTSWRPWTTRPQNHRSTRPWSAASKLWWTTRRAVPTSSLIQRASTSSLRAWPRRTSKPRWRCWRSWVPFAWCLVGTGRFWRPCCTTNALLVRGHDSRWVEGSTWFWISVDS